MENLSKFKIENSDNELSRIFGGEQIKTGGTASAPQTTMTTNIHCSDSQTNYDTDKGVSTGSCTTYSCA